MSEHTDKPADTGLATAFSMGPVILTITRLADGHFVEVNERFINFSGFTREEVLGRTPVEIGLWIDPAQRVEGLRRLREGLAVREVEANFRMKNGELRTCRQRAVVATAAQPRRCPGGAGRARCRRADCESGAAGRAARGG